MGTISAVGPGGFVLSGMGIAFQSAYGFAGGLNEFVDGQIRSMKASPDALVAGTARVLEGAKHGLVVGGIGPAVLMATGQLLLGNPLSAVSAAVTTLLSPTTATCAGIGAIWFGWRALSKEEQQAVLDKLGDAFSVPTDVIRQVIDTSLGTVKATFGSKELAELRGTLSNTAGLMGRSLYAVTGQMKDLLFAPCEEIDQFKLKGQPIPVLKAMDRESELEPLLVNVLKVDSKKVQSMVREGLERKALEELVAAATHSLPGAKAPSYDDTVRIVARQLKLPSRAEIRTEDLERAILFKVLERSLDSMSQEKKQSLASDVERSLRERGIDRKVTVGELGKFIKFTAMDLGGTVGGLAMTAPGIAGTVGFNALQYVVLQGILHTSGYVAAGGAMLGFGVGGTMVAVAGAAGPIGMALGLMYTAYSLSGPAFRKLVPAICVIAAKRVEIESLDVSDQVTPQAVATPQAGAATG